MALVMCAVRGLYTSINQNLMMSMARWVQTILLDSLCGFLLVTPRPISHANVVGKLNANIEKLCENWIGRSSIENAMEDLAKKI